MKNLFNQLPVLCTLLSALGLSAHAQGTAFTYQGRLNANGAAANGSYDLTFTLYTNSSTGNAIAGPVTNTATAVTNGLFATLVDFGPGVFTGGSNWLKIAVSTNGANSFTALAPRQQLTPTPYAIFAEGANAAGLAGTIASSNLANGTITSNLLAAGAVGANQLAANIGVWSQSGGNILYNNGNVGIGLSNPNNKLTVNGNIGLGSNGQDTAVRGLETLRIIRGVFLGTGVVNSGGGFTVAHPSTGNFDVTFASGFFGSPAVTVTPMTACLTYITSVSNGGVHIVAQDLAGHAVDPFALLFIAVGLPQ